MHSMRRIGLWAIGLCFLIVTLAMRFELAAPGISPLFTNLVSQAPTAPLSIGSVYSLAITLHHTAGLLIFGAIAISAARTAQNPIITTANWIKWAVWATLAVVVVSIVGLIPQQVPQFWAFLGGRVGDAQSRIEASGFGVVSDLHLQVLFCLTVMAAALMISRSPAERKAANAVCFGTLLALGFYIAAFIADTSALRLTIILAGGPLWLLAFCAFLQSDGDRNGNSYLMIGSLIAVISLISTNIDMAWDNGPWDTTWRTMLTHLGLISFGIFAGFAVLDVRLRPNLPRPLVWAHGLALALSVMGAFRPLGVIGRQGMPRGYVDYPESFTDGNLGATIGSYALLALIMIGVIMMRRYRQQVGGQAAPLTQAESQQPPAFPDHPPASAPRRLP